AGGEGGGRNGEGGKGDRREGGGSKYADGGRPPAGSRLTEAAPTLVRTSGRRLAGCGNSPQTGRRRADRRAGAYWRSLAATYREKAPRMDGDRAASVQRNRSAPRGVHCGRRHVFRTSCDVSGGFRAGFHLRNFLRSGHYPRAS